MSPPFPKLKLTYLNIKGRAESSRLALHIAGIPFEDERIGYATLVDMKQSYPFGQVPVLLVNDTIQIAQTHAILRYVGTPGWPLPCVVPPSRLALVSSLNLFRLCRRPSLKQWFDGLVYLSDLSESQPQAHECGFVTEKATYLLLPLKR
ncbi:hypothetical protein BASA62_005644 [Batrachochytrium salamandrivorans]|nr:hypothetical protein BASA62_005644 [Batrachochytrium salamandrivorans]